MVEPRRVGVRVPPTMTARLLLLLSSLCVASSASPTPPPALPPSPPPCGNWCGGSAAAAWTLGLGIPGAFILALSNGANDIANSVGTSVGANVLTMRQVRQLIERSSLSEEPETRSRTPAQRQVSRVSPSTCPCKISQALLAGSLFECIGALTIGPFVSSSIAGKEVHTDVFDDSPALFSLVMLASLLGAGGTTLLATLYGYPISATHGVISGIITVALCTGKSGVLDVDGISLVVAGWVASPVVGLLAGMLVSACVHHMVMAAPDPEAAARARQPFFLTITSAISFLFILLKGPPALSDWIGSRYWLALLLALAGGLLVTAAVHTATRLRERGLVMPGVGPGPTPGRGFDEPPSGILLTEGPTSDQGRAGSPTVTEQPGLASPLQFDELQRPFVPLLVVAGLTVALAHGANDVGNSVGPLSVIIDVKKYGYVDATPEVPFLAVVGGTAGFVAGILLIGSRTISTVASKITVLMPHRSFATQIGAAVAVLGSSVAGLPVSTSHCLVGSLIGVSFAEQLCGIENAKPDLSMLKKIVIGWVVTIPAAAAAAAAVYWPLKAIFD